MSPESHIQRHPLVNETIDPSFFIPGYLSDDPTSTPCGGRRVGQLLLVLLCVSKSSEGYFKKLNM